LAAWGALGFGFAATGFGVAAGTVALVKARTVKRHCSGQRCPASERSRAESAQSWADLATIGFAVGAVGIGGGLVLWEGSDTARGRLTPWFAATGAF
jgi:hypothetical protein